MSESPLSVLDHTDTSDDLIHIACEKCENRYSLCGVPKWGEGFSPEGVG